MTHITLRNGTYYIRIRVPASLVPIIGRHEVYRSLKTSNVRLATKRCGLLRAALIDFFAQAQEGALQRKDIKAKLDGLFHEILTDQCHYIDRYGPKSEPRIFFLEQLSNELHQAAELQRQGDVMESAKQLLHCQDRPLAWKRYRQAMDYLGDLSLADDKEMRMIRAEVMSMLSSYFGQAAYLHGDAKRYNYDPSKLVKDPAERSEIVISKALEKFALEKTRAKKWTEKTAGETEAPIKNLIEVCGDVPVKSITKDDAVRFKEVIAALPPNISKLRDRHFPAIMLQEIARMDHESLVSPRTVNKTLSRISTFFDWCVNNNYRKDNPFKGLRVEEAKRKASEERDAFENDEVLQIVGLAKKQADAWKKWVPLIGIYSGLRLNEICQLHKEDVVTEENVLCFKITDEHDGQKLKTQNSRRLVPVHSRLIEERFETYVSESEPGLLFPDFKLTKNGYSDAASKWFNRTFTKKLNLKPGQKTFHSLRHTFITALKRSKVDTPITNALVGHAEKSLAYGRYGKDYELSTLQDAVEAVNFE